MASAQEVKKLRQETGAGFLNCKQALESSKDFQSAIDWLKKKGLSQALKKSQRQAKEGLVFSYIHGEGRMGVMLEVNSETDFVSRNDQFKKFVKDLALHIVAMNPLYIKEEDIPPELLEKEKSIFLEQARSKNPKMAERISEGLYKKWLGEKCLLYQEFVRESSESKQTVETALKSLIALVGENIVIRRFVRFVLGETNAKNSN